MSASVNSATAPNLGRELIMRAKHDVHAKAELKAVYQNLKGQINAYVSGAPSALSNYMIFQVGLYNQYSFTRKEKLAIYTWLGANLAHKKIRSETAYIGGKFTGLWVYHPDRRQLTEAESYDNTEMSEGYVGPTDRSQNQYNENLQRIIERIINHVRIKLETDYSVVLTGKAEVGLDAYDLNECFPYIRDQMQGTGVRVHQTYTAIIITKY